jgi:uncharacterized membrane protein (UPF0127 family)
MGASGIGPLPPPTRTAREVVVFRPGLGEVARIAEPGVHAVPFPCAHVEGESGGLEVRITTPDQAERAPAYRRCTPQEAQRLAGAGAAQKLEFRDVVAHAHSPVPARRPTVLLADGRGVPLGTVLTMKAGPRCLVSARNEDARAAAAVLVAGDEVTVRGEPVRLRSEEACILVEQLALAAGSLAPAEPPWRVAVFWGGAEVAHLSEPGDCPLRLPCPHSEGAVELAGVRLREFEVVDLRVGGHSVAAELADAPGTINRGLQGRPGLGPDAGMLFFFKRPIRPIFVMKGVSFPLDIVFIRADGTILSIQWRAPGDQRPATAPVPVNHVLEMEGGWFREHGVAPGAKVELSP